MFSSQTTSKPGSVLASHLSSPDVAIKIKRFLRWVPAEEPGYKVSVKTSISLQQVGFTLL
jgi:hypothetical protein